MSGPDVPKTGDFGLVPMTRIAPTVATWFDVRLSPDADRAARTCPADQRPLAIQAAGAGADSGAVLGASFAQVLDRIIDPSAERGERRRLPPA